MELYVNNSFYINNSWTERCGNAYAAEAIACSENGNHAEPHLSFHRDFSDSFSRQLDK